MRDIKFRGKSTVTNQWVLGGYHKHVKRQICPMGDELKPDDIDHIIIFDGFADWNMPKPLQAVEVIPETVGEYIERKDKNGKEIYEGDIFKLGNKVIVINVKECGNFHNIEIIGNIHDNPELLEG